jgi:hypothetical protein
MKMLDHCHINELVCVTQFFTYYSKLFTMQSKVQSSISLLAFKRRSDIVQDLLVTHVHADRCSEFISTSAYMPIRPRI